MDELPNDGRLVALLTYPSSLFVRQGPELVPSASDRDQSERDGHKSSNGKHHPHGGLLPGIVYRGWVKFLQSVRRGGLVEPPASEVPHSDLADRAHRLARHHVGRLKEYPLLSSKLGNEPQEAEYSLRSRGEPLARLGHWLRRGCGPKPTTEPRRGSVTEWRRWPPVQRTKRH